MNTPIRILKASTYRQTVLAIFILSAVGTCASLFEQYVMKMNPCVMCIEQRMSLVAIAVLSLLCQLLPLHKITGKTIAALIISAPAVFGWAVAAKQIWLQGLPFDQQPDCGAPWTFRLRSAPLFDLYEPLIRGSGFCGEIYRLFGISLPVWAILFFSMILIIVWFMFWYTRKNRFQAA